MTGIVVHLSAPEGEDIPRSLLEEAVHLTLREEGWEEGEVSVAFLTDDEARRMNREHLGHDWVPDVLSFELHGVEEPPHADLYVGIEQARRQALDEGVAEVEELVRLVIHGLLHTLGWDHPEEAEARGESPHYRRQEELLARVMSS